MHRASSTDVSPSLEALSCPQRHRPPSASSSSSSHHDRHQHQRAHVRRVLQARHAFEVLELPLQTTSSAAVRQAFRKFALLLHPDKNAAPDAQKAFIRLSEAYEVLRDVGEQKSLLGKLRPPKRKGGGGRKEDEFYDSTTVWTSFSFVRPTSTSTGSSNSTGSGSTTSKSKRTPFPSSRSFMDVLREWEDFEREYMEELRGKQTSLEAQARKEKRQSRREDVEECQAAERRILLAHLMESMQDDEDEEKKEDGKKGKEGVKEEGEVEEEQTPKRKENTWQNFLKGKKRKRRGGKGK